jgi:hypothetical protein
VTEDFRGAGAAWGGGGSSAGEYEGEEAGGTDAEATADSPPLRLFSISLTAWAVRSTTAQAPRLAIKPQAIKRAKKRRI